MHVQADTQRRPTTHQPQPSPLQPLRLSPQSLLHHTQAPHSLTLCMTTSLTHHCVLLLCVECITHSLTHSAPLCVCVSSEDGKSPPPPPPCLACGAVPCRAMPCHAMPGEATHTHTHTHTHTRLLDAGWMHWNSPSTLSTCLFIYLSIYLLVYLSIYYLLSCLFEGIFED